MNQDAAFAAAAPNDAALAGAGIPAITATTAAVNAAPGLLFSSVWTLDPGHMGFRLWRRLDARDWRDLVDLIETYRAVHQAAAESGDPLWP